MILIDQSLALRSYPEILHLDFPVSLRENALLWLLGSYIEIVETEVVLKDHVLDHHSIAGLLKQKKQIARHLAMPDLGMIPGLDWDLQGIG